MQDDGKYASRFSTKPSGGFCAVLPKGSDSMKQIGLIIPAITEDSHRELIESIYRTAVAANCDVILLTTATTGLEYHIQSEMMTGEENIYTLIGHIRLDGVLFASQFYTKASVRNAVTARIKAADIPCIDLGGSELCFETVSIPQDKIMYELTDHLIVKHGCQNLLFLAGPKGNADSDLRLSGFLCSVQDHSCESEIIYGDFGKECAVLLGNELLKQKHPMPDAVVCASDTMAVSLCEELKNGCVSAAAARLGTGLRLSCYRL